MHEWTTRKFAWLSFDLLRADAELERPAGTLRQAAREVPHIAAAAGELRKIRRLLFAVAVGDVAATATATSQPSLLTRRVSRERGPAPNPNVPSSHSAVPSTPPRTRLPPSPPPTWTPPSPGWSKPPKPPCAGEGSGGGCMITATICIAKVTTGFTGITGDSRTRIRGYGGSRTPLRRGGVRRKTPARQRPWQPRRDSENRFPSWTSRVRVPSPALDASRVPPPGDDPPFEGGNARAGGRS